MERRVAKKLKTATPEYVEKAMALTRGDAERLMARMRKKLARRLEDKKVQPLDAVALQLQLDDEQLQAWREKLSAIRKKEQ